MLQKWLLTTLTIAAIFVLWDRTSAALEFLGLPGWIAIWISLIIVGLLMAKLMKIVIQMSLPNQFSIAPTSISQSWIDINQFVQRTADLCALGFEVMGDYEARTDKLNSAVVITRIFRSTEHLCYAELNQATRPNGSITPVSAVISCKMSGDWTISVTDRIIDNSGWIIRRPRGVWNSHPGAELKDLFADLLALRNTMISDLGIQVQKDLSLNTFLINEEEQLEEIKAAIKSKPAAIILLEMILFSLQQHREWRGDWKKQLSSK